MEKKEKLHEVTELLVKNQYLDHFCIGEPIAKDFVLNHVVVDMYCDATKKGFVKYITLGVCKKYLDNGWYEFSFATPHRLDYATEKTMLEEIDNITCKLIERKYDDTFFDIETGVVFPTLKTTKDTLGYDGFILELHDMGFTFLTGEPLYIILLVPVFENEMNYIKENGYDLFSEKYDELVPDDKQLLVGVIREPLNL